MNANIEFISYDYDRHSLCMGELVAKVNGNVYRFHYLWENRMKDPARSGEVWCPPFWRSGGCLEQDEELGMWAEEGDWGAVRKRMFQEGLSGRSLGQP